MCRARRSPGRRGKSPAEPAPIQTAALDPPEQQESDGEECASLVFSEQESVNDTEEVQPVPPPAAQPPAAGRGRGGGPKPASQLAAARGRGRGGEGGRGRGRGHGSSCVTVRQAASSPSRRPHAQSTWVAAAFLRTIASFSSKCIRGCVQLLWLCVCSERGPIPRARRSRARLRRGRCPGTCANSCGQLRVWHGCCGVVSSSITCL